MNRKTVSFSPMVMMMPVMHINEYSDEEKRECWFSDEEMQDIKWQVRTIVSFLKDPPIGDSSLQELSQQTFYSKDNFLRRGLERYLPGSEQENQSKRKSIHLVIEDQYFTGDDDEDKENGDESLLALGVALDFELAQNYNEACLKCTEAAYLRGISDAMIAKSVLDENPSPWQPVGDENTDSLSGTSMNVV